MAGLDSRRRAVVVAMAFKVALALCFVVAIAVPLDHLEGKGMLYRFPLFMLSAVVVPLAWRGRFRPYPATADVLIVAPFLIDTLGNLAYVYDTFEATDDVLHTLNWILLVGAFHAWRYRRGGANLSRADAWLLGASLGALAIVGWEAAEWIVAETGAGGGLDLTYDDTVADLVLSTGGGMIGSALAVAYFPTRTT
ncbi:hypothetical protein [Candidatus Poriferisodalis sp.]|uniref:hypothetical protein n=1 Tax=Candidatus Poriferisodalis sp. TaxID=3101277 RepID=UPI003B02B3CD